MMTTSQSHCEDSRATFILWTAKALKNYSFEFILLSLVLVSWGLGKVFTDLSGALCDPSREAGGSDRYISHNPSPQGTKEPVALL